MSSLPYVHMGRGLMLQSVEMGQTHQNGPMVAKCQEETLVFSGVGHIEIGTHFTLQCLSYVILPLLFGTLIRLLRLFAIVSVPCSCMVLKLKQ